MMRERVVVSDMIKCRFELETQLLCVQVRMRLI